MTSITPVGIVRIGHPVLHQVARPVSADLRQSSAFHELVEIMKLTLEGRGVGLAAPQIGVGLRLFVMEDPKPRVDADKDAGVKERTAFPFEAVVNPAWQPLGDEMRTFPEGCLSIPGLLAPIPRHRVIEAEWTTLDGVPRAEKLQGWPARIFQHESDHLDGRLYLDYLEDRPSVSYREIGRGVSDDLLMRLGLETASR